MDDIAVLIPCYNEDKTIEKVVSDFKRVLPDAIITCMTIIQQMTQRSLQKRQEL